MAASSGGGNPLRAWSLCISLRFQLPLPRQSRAPYRSVKRKGSPSQDIAVQGRVLVLLRLLDMLMTVANLVFLSVLSPPVPVGFGLSQEIIRSGVSLSHGRQIGRWLGGGGGGGGRAVVAVKRASAREGRTSCYQNRRAPCLLLVSTGEKRPCPPQEAPKMDPPSWEPDFAGRAGRG